MKFLKGGIIGVIIGAVAGILFAPKSGKETRADLTDSAQDMMAKAEKKLKKSYTDVQKQIDEAHSQAKGASKKAAKELNELADAAQPLQDKVKELISNIREGSDINEKEVNDLVEKAKKTADEIKKATKK